MIRNQRTSPEELERLRTKADAVRRAALNLSMTYGVFHGINSASGKPVINTDVSQAINSIQHDLLHLMVIRLYALCDHGPRPDDASIIALERGITRAIRQQLIADDQHWRRAIGSRAERVIDVAHSIADLRRQRASLLSQNAALASIKHFCDKLLAHVTVGHSDANEVRLGVLWTLTRTVLTAARCVGLIFHRADCDYVEEARSAERQGSELAKAIIVKPPNPST
jgi:hypothetical protein